MQERLPKDEEIEDRMAYEIVVDAHDAEEHALGWYYYLAENLSFPFEARCKEERTVSPLLEGETVHVTGMADEQDCMVEMIVLINWQGRTMGVPLAQLAPIDVDETAATAVADWHYWVGRGYRLAG